MLETGWELNRCSRRFLINSELGLSDESSPCVSFTVLFVAACSSRLCCSATLGEFASAVKEMGGSLELATDSLDPVGREVSSPSEDPVVGDAALAVVVGTSLLNGIGYPGKPGPAGKLTGQNNE